MKTSAAIISTNVVSSNPCPTTKLSTLADSLEANSSYTLFCTKIRLAHIPDEFVVEEFVLGGLVVSAGDMLTRLTSVPKFTRNGTWKAIRYYIRRTVDVIPSTAASTSASLKTMNAA
jgi:hypothetical protein